MKAILLLTLLLLAGQYSPQTIQERCEARRFPSVFMAWNPADDASDKPTMTTAAKHDLIFIGVEGTGLKWQGDLPGTATAFTPESIETARRRIEELRRKNPQQIRLVEIRYRDAGRGYLPDDHRWWKRDAQGKRVIGWEEGGYFTLDYAAPEYQAQVAAQTKAVMQTGLFDGVMLDWWEDDADRLTLVKTVRSAIGENALILVNANDHTVPRTAAYVNGLFMECYRSKTAEDWKRITDTLVWAEAHLRQPRINCLETWYHRSRNDLHLMRATTTLALTLSDGYCLFSDPNDLPTPDHAHNWYGFWNKSLGKPKGRGKMQKDGSCRREFEGGTVVYNPMGNASIEVTFPTRRYSAATGVTAHTHTLLNCDGSLFLLTKPKP